MLGSLEYEIRANGDRDIIIDLDVSLKYFKDVYIGDGHIQIPPKAEIFFNSDEKNLYIQNFPY